MRALPPGSMASRAVALGLLGLLAAAVWMGAVDPIMKRYDNNDQSIAGGIRLLAGLRSTIVQSRQASMQMTAGDLDRYREDFLAGPEDAIIVAELQTRLSSLIAARNAEVSSARALPPKSRDGLEYLGLGLQIRAEMKSIQDVLHAIETGTPLLFVERTDLRLDERGTAAGRARNPAAVAPMVLEIAVYGAKWPGAARAPERTSGPASGSTKAP
jgi:hypothetical protein